MRAFTIASGRLPLAGQMEQVRPELSFGDHDEPWLESVQISADSKAEIERHKEYMVFTKALAGQCLARCSGGGNKNLPVRMLLLEVVNQLTYCQHFAYGNGMYPDRARLSDVQSGWHNAYALP